MADRVIKSFLLCCLSVNSPSSPAVAHCHACNILPSPLQFPLLQIREMGMCVCVCGINSEYGGGSTAGRLVYEKGKQKTSYGGIKFTHTYFY